MRKKENQIILILGLVLIVVQSLAIYHFGQATMWRATAVSYAEIAGESEARIDLKDGKAKPRHIDNSVDQGSPMDLCRYRSTLAYNRLLEERRGNE